MSELSPSIDRDLQEARTRLANVAVGLSRLFGRDEAARTLIGCAIGILGAERAADLLAAIVLEIDRGEPDGDAPTTPENPVN